MVLRIRSLFIDKKAALFSPKYQRDGRLSTEVLEEALKITNEEGSFTYEFDHITVHDIEVVCEIKLAKIEYRNKLAYIASFTDITSKKYYDLRLKALLQIADYEIESLDKFMIFAMKTILSLFQSQIIFVFSYDEATRKLIINSFGQYNIDKPFSTNIGVECPLGEDGIWWKVVRSKKPLIDNDLDDIFKCSEELPFDILNIKKLLAVPITYQGRLVGVYGIANRKRDYAETTANQLKMFCDSVYKKTVLYKNTQQLIEARDLAEAAAEAKSKIPS